VSSLLSGIVQVGYHSLESRIAGCQSGKFLSRAMPMARSSGGIIVEGLAPGTLERSRRGIQLEVLDQSSRAIAGLQKAGTSGSAKADNTYHLALTIKGRPTAVALFYIAPYLDDLRPTVGCLDRADKDAIHR
jgi:hypothetical protein